MTRIIVAKYFVIILGLFFLVPNTAFAIPSFGATSFGVIWQLILVTVSFLSAFVFILFNLLKKQKKIFVLFIFFVLGITFFYAAYGLKKFRQAKIMQGPVVFEMTEEEKVDDTNNPEYAKVLWNFDANFLKTDPVIYQKYGIEAREVFSDLKNKKKDVVIVDVREEVETTVGIIPKALNYRLGDLTDKYKELKGKKVYVFCHNGGPKDLRSGMAVSILREKGVEAFFVKGGVRNWYNNYKGSYWQGGSPESYLVYPNARKILSPCPTANLKEIYMFDFRVKNAGITQKGEEIINFPILLKSKSDLSNLFKNLDEEISILGLCYDQLSCFSAYVFGYEASIRGYKWLGRCAISPYK